jgi:hypothetical protein
MTCGRGVNTVGGPFLEEFEGGNASVSLRESGAIVWDAGRVTTAVAIRDGIALEENGAVVRDHGVGFSKSSPGFYLMIWSGALRRSGPLIMPFVMASLSSETLIHGIRIVVGTLHLRGSEPAVGAHTTIRKEDIALARVTRRAGKGAIHTVIVLVGIRHTKPGIEIVSRENQTRRTGDF